MFIGNFKDEDFFQESFDPFLKQRPTTNILNTLVTDETARSLISELFVLNCTTKGKQALKTEFHLQWAMECIGYSFSLPAKRFFSTLLTSITIYSDWLNYPDYAPEFIKASRCFYIQEILGHMSLAFYPQRDVPKQYEICSEILNVIDKFTNGQVLSEESWMCLLKLAIEIGRAVMENGRLVEVLGSRVIKFVFQMFLKTECRNFAVWDEFVRFLWRVCENYWVSVYWGACVKGLTRKVVKLMMSKNKGFLKIEFLSAKHSMDEMVLEKDPESVVFLWTRFLCMFLWQEREIVSNRTGIVSGICSVVKLFVDKCEKLNRSVELAAPTYIVISSSSEINALFAQIYKTFIKYLHLECRLPTFSINSLLTSFGDLLFSVVSDPKFSVSEKIESVQVLCEVFSKARGPLQINYVEKFLLGIIQCISIKDFSLMSAICEGFLTLPSSSLYFLNFTLKTDIILQVLSFFLLNNQSPVNMRLMSLKFLSTFAPLASFYSVPGLVQQISEVLITSFELETDEQCFELVIWTIVSYLACFKGDLSVADGYLRTLAEKLESLDVTCQNYFVIVDALSLLPYLIEKKVIKGETVEFCIRKLLAGFPKRGKNIEGQVFRVFQCVVDFILYFPEAFYDEEHRNEILKSFEFKKSDEKGKDFQSYLNDLLFNRLGKIRSDKCVNLTKGWEGPIGFYTEHVQGAFIESNNALQIYVQNSTGEYSWKLSEVGYDVQKTIKPVFELIKTEVNKLDFVKNTKILKEELDNVFEVEMEKRIVDKYKAQMEICLGFEADGKNAEFESKRFMKGKEEVNCERRFLRNFRRLAAQLGFLELSSNAFVFKVQQEQKSDIGQYEQMMVSLVYDVKVIYLSTPETTGIECMKAAQHYSPSFTKFLNNLGVLITDKDYSPISCKNSIHEYKKCIFRDCKLFETVFTSQALFPEGFNIELLNFVQSAHCIVLWNQRLNDSESKKLPIILASLEKLQKFIVLITPISKKIAKINLFGGNPGLLVDNMVVSLKMLRKILIFSVHRVNYKFSQRFTMWKSRSDYLKEFIHKGTNERLSIKDFLWIFE